jgi:DNA-binding NarL/FixJ family response regulator
MKKYRILLADDHKIVLEGLRALLEPDFELVGSVTNGRDLVTECLRLEPDVVVADISMPLLNGIEATQQILERGSSAKVVLLTMHPDATYATRAFEAGASAYVLKHSASDELVAAIQEALQGKTYVSLGMRVAAVEEIVMPGSKRTKPVIELTMRQREVLQLVAEGKSAKEIAALLDISPRTAEKHKYQIMDALGTKTSAELVQYAIRHGLVTV